MTIMEILSCNSQKYTNETSLIELEPSINQRKEITWLEFESMANSFANFLLSRNIKKGDKVAMLMMNCLEWLPIYFGILKTGAIVVPLNFRFTADEIKKCIEVADVKILIYGPEFQERISKIEGKLNHLKNIIFVGRSCPDNAMDYFDILYEFPDDAPSVNISEQDEAGLYFTSGTTGMPKPIILTHSNLYSACITENHSHMQTQEDNFLCIPPLYHTGAKMHWFGSLLVGSRATILKGVKPEWILKAVSEEKATIVWLLVPWAQDILDAIESGKVDISDYTLEQWRLMHIGAQPVPPSLIMEWKKYFPDQLYDTNYGLSESTGPGCVHLGIDNIHKVGSIGVPGFGWEAMIVDDDGDPLHDGEIGELIVRGPGVMKGYYNNPEATRKVLKKGWLYTGDMAYQDEDGFIYLVDRKKDVVISGGENIFPVEIENFLQAHLDIKDVAVVGIPDRRLGEVPLAVVELKMGRNLTEDDLLQFCEGLPRYKRPHKIVFDKVPRNLTGKIEKTKLREKWSTDHSRVFVGNR
jgi:acyl-CoA synthetase (AMP-forming)/AMP-acid ligase II